MVERWLDLLPEELKRERPSLLLAQAWGLYERYRISDMSAVLEQAGSALDEGAAGQQLAGELSFLRGAVEYWEGKGESLDDPVANPDGSVDVYFGPTAPEGKERNWVPTNHAKGFFVVFRFYGPTEGYIEKTWVLDDFELLD